MTASEVTDLPEPDSPTMPEHLAGAQRVVDAADGVDDPSSVGKGR